MDISTYLDPINLENLKVSNNTGRLRLADIIFKYIDENNFPNLEQVDIAIIGVGEDRGTLNKGCDAAFGKFLVRASNSCL